MRILSRRDVVDLLSLRDCIAAVENAFRLHAELGDVVAGRRPGRTRDDEITIFDSSGTALQDVAAAVVIYEKAVINGRGTEVELDD